VIEVIKAGEALKQTSDMSLPSKLMQVPYPRRLVLTRTVMYSSEQRTNNISCSFTRSSGAAT
jgi:hypothetical protein